MKYNYLIPVVLLIGVAVLFFFPSPEENFLMYVGTAMFFVILTVFLVVRAKRKK